MEVSSQGARPGSHRSAVRLRCAAFTNLKPRSSRLSRDPWKRTAPPGAVVRCGRPRSTSCSTRRRVPGGPARRELSGRLPVTATWIGHPAIPASGSPSTTCTRRKYRSTVHGISLQFFKGSYGSQHLDTKLLGRFNAENSLIVMGCLLALGALLKRRVPLAACVPPPGRMAACEPTAPGKPLVVVDLLAYAGRARAGLAGASLAYQGQADLRLRRRWRSRPGQAPDHGRRRRAPGRCGHRYGRQSAHGRRRHHRRADHGRLRARDTVRVERDRAQAIALALADAKADDSC